MKFLLGSNVLSLNVLNDMTIMQDQEPIAEDQEFLKL